MPEDHPRHRLYLILWIAFSVIVSLATVEIIFTGYYFFEEGSFVSTEELLFRSHPYLDSSPNQIKQWQIEGEVRTCAWYESLQTHPYLGYVNIPTPPCGDPAVNNRGFWGPDYPIKKEPGTFIIMLTGGSVASWLFALRPDPNGPLYLQEELDAHYTSPKIKKFIVLDGSNGGWGQPNQFIQYALNSDIIDGVVTLDGYNELQKIKSDLMFERPLESQVLAQVSNSMDLSKVLCSYSEMKIYRWFDNKRNPFRKSKALFYLAEGIRNRLRACVLEYREEDFDPFSFPEEISSRERQSINLNRYISYVEMMDTIAKSKKAKSLHFIQPVPAIGKRLTDSEIEVVGKLDYSSHYLKLTESMLALNGKNSRVISLANVFSDVSEPLYIDEIHTSPKGLKILGDAVLKGIAKTWGLQRQELAH